MKLGFSTLGCPKWSFDEILTNAKNYGFDGFEVRGIQGEMDLLRIPEFQPANRAESLQRVKDAGLEIMMMMTGCRFSSADPQERQTNIDDAKANMDLALDLGADKIRVYGGRIAPEVNKEDAYQWVAESLRNVAEYGATVGAYAAIETHDDFTDTNLVRDTLARVDHPHLKVQWDTHHPFRVYGQGPELCWQNVGPHVVDTHFKDSFLTEERKNGYEYCLLGDGDIPIVETLKVLKAGGYNGYLTLEWEKAWQDYLPEPEVGFPQYVNKMKEYLAQLG